MPPDRLLPIGHRILSGHFHEGRSYRVRRTRGSNDWLLIHTVAGAGRIRSGDLQRQVTSGETVLWRPGTSQDYATDDGVGRWELLWAHVLPPDQWDDLLEWPELTPGLLHRQVPSDDREGVAQCLRDMTICGRDALGERLAFNALERALLLMARGIEETDAGAEGGDRRIRQVRELMLRQPGRAWTVDELARRTGWSASRFAHRFRSEVGCSVVQWRDRIRIEAACRLLATSDHTIAAIAQALGFTDATHFSTRFRTLQGVNPLRWRQAAQRKAQRQQESPSP